MDKLPQLLGSRFTIRNGAIIIFKARQSPGRRCAGAELRPASPERNSEPNNESGGAISRAEDRQHRREFIQPFFVFSSHHHFKYQNTGADDASTILEPIDPKCGENVIGKCRMCG
jgi:hypothetical protein